jgi:hypothetical protein
MNTYSAAVGVHNEWYYLYTGLEDFLIFSRTDAANATENIPSQSVCISCILDKFTGALTF